MLRCWKRDLNSWRVGVCSEFEDRRLGDVVAAGVSIAGDQIGYTRYSEV